jgi:deazaflavin-dependent oxidoreductase (nitroreductase family)
VDKRALSTFLQTRLFNPLVRRVAGTRLAPGYALLETTGRRSGEPRRTPVGNGLDPDGRTFWIVAEHGRRAGYIRNIQANPRARVKVRGGWRTGSARTVPEEDPRERQRLIGRRMNAAVVRLMGSDLLVVRIDLDA